MKKVNTKIPLALLIIVALVLLSLIILGYLNIRKQNLATAEILASSQSTERAEKEIQAVRAIQTSAREDIALFEELALSNDKLISLIENIEEAGRTLDLDLEIVSVGKKETEGNAPQIIHLTINGKGAWAGVYSLLKTIESLPYRVMIENASLEKANNVWDETIVISLHSFK